MGEPCRIVFVIQSAINCKHTLWWEKVVESEKMIGTCTCTGIRSVMAKNELSQSKSKPESEMTYRKHWAVCCRRLSVISVGLRHADRCCVTTSPNVWNETTGCHRNNTLRNSSMPFFKIYTNKFPHQALNPPTHLFRYMLISKYKN